MDAAGLCHFKAAQNAMTFAFGHQFKKDKSQKQIFAVMPGAVATDLNGAKVGDSPLSNLQKKQLK